MGNTLDDGTTLGQYAEALQKVGINIKDSNGELKNMDTILNEMGAKWNTLNKAQQVALAQNVAGTRQYTQLVALMDNWDKFSANLQVAANSTGTLQAQQDTYLESTEAHINQLTASIERFMDALIDNKSINSLIDGLTRVVNMFSLFTESIGGGGNLLLLLGTIGEKVFSTQISRGLVAANAQMQQFVDNSRQAAAQEKLLEQFSSLPDPAVKAITEVFKQFKGLEGFLNQELTDVISNYAKEAGELQQQLLDIQVENDKGYEAITKLYAGDKQRSKGRFSAHPEKGNTYGRNVFETFELGESTPEGRMGWVQDRTKHLSTLLDNIEKKYNNLKKDALQTDLEIGDEKSKNQISRRLKSQAYSLKKDIDEILFEGQEFISAEDAFQLKTLSGSMAQGSWIRDQKDVNRQRPNIGTVKRFDRIDALFKKDMFKGLKEGIQEANQYLDNFGNNLEEDVKGKIEGNTSAIEQFKKSLKNSVDQKYFLDMATGVSQVAMGFNSLIYLTNIWKNDSLSASEKVTQTIINVGTALPMIANGFKTAISSGKQLIPVLKQLGAAMWEALGPWGVIASVIAVAVGGIIVAYDKWFDKEARIQKQLEQTKKQVHEVSTAYNELNNTLTNYKSAKDGLKGLTEGSIEFYNQIIKINEEATKLIDSLHLVAGTDYQISANGLISIDEVKLTTAMFKEQQKTYQAQANFVKAQYQNAQYQQDQVVKQFQNSLNRKSSASLYSPKGYTENNARNILAGKERAFGETSYLQGLWNYLTTDFNSGIKVEFSENGLMKIDEEIGTFRTQYNEKTAEMLAYQRQIADNTLRGYGSESAVKQYNDLTEEARTNIQDILSEEIQSINNYTANLQNGWNEFWDMSADSFLTVLGKTALGMIPGIGWYGLESTFQDNGISNKELKELYAENVLGGQKVGKTWVNADGTPINLSDINLDIAKNAYVQSGGYNASSIIDEILNLSTQSYTNARARGLNEDAANQVSEAYMAIKSGREDYDFSYLTKEQYNTLSSQIWKDAYDSGLRFDEQGRAQLTGDRNIDNQNAQELNRLLQIQNTLLNQTEEEQQAKLDAKNLKEYNEEIQNQAVALGTTESALKLYDYALQNANGDEINYTKSMADNAAASYKFNKAYNEGRTTFEKNEDAFDSYVEALQKGEEVSYDVADGAGAIIDSLKGMGIELSAKDLKNPETIKNIKNLLSGTKEEAEAAYKELEKASWAEKLRNNFKMAEDAIDSVVNKLAEAKDGAVFSLKDLGLENIEGTADEIKAKLESLNLHISDDELQAALQQVNDPKTTEQTIKENKLSTKTITVHELSKNPYTGSDEGLTYTDTATVQDVKYTLGNANVTYKTTAKNFTGSGSSSKSKSKSTSKTKGEADRYHEVNTQIAKVNAELSKLEKQSQKTLGGDLLKNLNKQWQDLNKQAQNYNEKLKIARNEQEEVRKKLQKLGLGVKFNADGTIANYVEMYNKALKQLNAAEDKNDKKNSNANQKRVDKLKTQFEDLQKYMDRNDELISSFIPDIYAQAQEAMDKQVETNLKEFRAGIALAVDIKDLRVNWNDFKAKFIEDLQDSDVLGNVALDRANTAEVQKLIGDRTKQLNAAVSELSRNAAHLQNLTGDDLVKAIEEAKTNYEDLMKDYQELVELRNHAEELYKQALEDEKQAIQDQLDLYGKINDQLEKDKKLVELTYGDKAYDKLVKYSKLQDANNKEILKADVEAEKTAKRRYEEAQQMYQDGKLQAEDLKNAEADLLEASARVTDDLNNSLEHLQDTLKTTADAIAKAYSQDVSDAAGGLDFAQEEWDLINKHADQYLDTINRLTGENQLESKYLESIEKATSPAIQKKLKDAMDSEMKSLREKDKLSQYDLDRANKKYQVTLAQIALEEAQDNKSQMRLRRDSQGNYRYQYVADETQVNAAEEGLRTALADLYNFDKDRLKTTYNDILAIEKEYNQKRAEILADPNLSPEERLEKVRLLHEQYEGPDGLITNAYALGADARANVMDSAFEDLAYLQEKNKEDFINMTDAEQDAIMTGLIPAWDSLAAKMAEVGANVDAQQQYWQDAKDALVDYQNAMAEDLNITGKDTEDIANATDSDLDFIEGLIKPMSEVLNEQNNIVEGARNWYIEISNIKDGLTPVVKALQNAKDTIDAIDSKKLQEIGIATGYNRTDATLDEFMNGGSQGGENNNANVANLPSNPGQAHPYGLISDFEGTISSKSSAKAIKAVQYALQQLGYDIGASGVDGKLGAKTKAAITAFQKANGGSDNGGKVGPKTKEWFRLKGFDTGGYTGTWDDNNGRLAFLHQKELVLNSEDTKNILAATRTIRQAMVAKQDSLISAGVTPMGNDILEQNVHIEATFPNATSANEIEEALRNLVNAAAQRRRKI